MTYATQQDMIDQFGLREMRCIADPANSGEIDSAIVNKALVTASGRMDFAIAQHNVLPLANLPAYVVTFLAELCCAIARHNLTGSSEVTVTTEAQKRYDEALVSLEKIASGKPLLAAKTGMDGSGGVATVTLTSGEAYINEGAEPMFSSGAQRDYFK